MGSLLAMFASESQGNDIGSILILAVSSSIYCFSIIPIGTFIILFLERKFIFTKPILLCLFLSIICFISIHLSVFYNLNNPFFNSLFSIIYLLSPVFIFLTFYKLIGIQSDVLERKLKKLF